MLPWLLIKLGYLKRPGKCVYPEKYFWNSQIQNHFCVRKTRTSGHLVQVGQVWEDCWSAIERRKDWTYYWEQVHEIQLCIRNVGQEIYKQVVNECAHMCKENVRIHHVALLPKLKTRKKELNMPILKLSERHNYMIHSI